MDARRSSTCHAFFEGKLIAKGAPADVAMKMKPGAMAFDDTTSELLEFELIDEPLQSGPGRPKLGVVPREITLLPRHWDWLAAQPGGASPTIRRLIEEAAKAPNPRQAAAVAYKFLSQIAGNLPNFEEAIRGLFAADRAKFVRHMKGWPKDVRDHATRLAEPAF